MYAAAVAHERAASLAVLKGTRIYEMDSPIHQNHPPTFTRIRFTRIRPKYIRYIS